MLTTQAEDSLGHIHDRMPLMVERDRWGDWLDPRVGGELSLLVPAAPGSLEAYPVPPLVSNVRNNGPELVEPLPAGGRALMIKAVIRTITTPYGDGRLHVRRAVSPIATLLLSHGAGRGVDAPDLMALAGALPVHGVSVLLFEQPWHVAGRKVATPPPTLDAGLIGRGQLAAHADPARGRRPVRGRPLRRALREAAGGPRRARPVLPPAPARPAGEDAGVDELRGAGLPMLVVQGERDPMGRPEEFPTDVAGLDMTVIPEADHGLKVPKRAALSQAESLGIVVESTLEWLIRDIAGSR